MAAKAEKQQVVLIAQNVFLDRIRLTFPPEMTPASAMRAGVLIGGAQLVAAEGLRLLALDQIEELGVTVDWKRASARGALPAGLRIVPRRHSTNVLPR